MQTSATANPNESGSSLPQARFNWIFPAEKFVSTPSSRDGISPEEELSHRQQAAVFIYELGTFLKVYVLISIDQVSRKIFLHFRPHYCINTALVYMHRFFMINSFQRFVRQVSYLRWGFP
jgi:cyclin T